MKRLALAAVVWTLAVACIPADAPSTAKTHQVELNGHTFTLPSDFDIELAADRRWSIGPSSPTSTNRAGCTSPIRRARTSTVAKQLAKKPHRILRLEDTDGDGKFDRTHRVRRQDDVSRRNACGSTARSTSPRRRASGS